MYPIFRLANFFCVGPYSKYFQLHTVSVATTEPYFLGTAEFQQNFTKAGSGWIWLDGGSFHPLSRLVFPDFCDSEFLLYLVLASHEWPSIETMLRFISRFDFSLIMFTVELDIHMFAFTTISLCFILFHFHHSF